MEVMFLFKQVCNCVFFVTLHISGMRPVKRKLTKVTQSLIDVFAMAAGKASLTFICLLFLSKRDGFLIHHGRSFVQWVKNVYRWSVHTMQGLVSHNIIYCEMSHDALKEMQNFPLSSCVQEAFWRFKCTRGQDLCLTLKRWSKTLLWVYECVLVRFHRRIM